MAAERRAAEDRAAVERLRVELEQTRTDHHDEIAALRREAEERAALRQEAREQPAAVLARLDTAGAPPPALPRGRTKHPTAE